MQIVERNSVQINNLVPGTVYLFKVEALDSNGNAGGSSMEEQFETSPEGSGQKHVRKRSPAQFRVRISLKYCPLPSFRIPFSQQDCGHPRRGGRRSDGAVLRARGPVPAQAVSNCSPADLSQCDALRCLPPSFFCISFCGASKRPLHSFSPHLSLFLFLSPTVSFSLSGSVSQHSPGRNLN